MLPKIIDLFSGCGGLALGFEKAGFEIVAGIDNMPEAIKTISYNLSWRYGKEESHICGDITEMDGEMFSNYIGEEGCIVIGGPPCQAYSRAGRGKLRSLGEERVNTNDLRGYLYLDFLRFVFSLNARAVVMENVPEATNYGGENIPQHICEILDNNGYNASWTVLNSADFGVPQIRERVFVIAIKNDEERQIHLPIPTHKNYNNNLTMYQKRLESFSSSINFTLPKNSGKAERSWITVGQALSDLPELFPNENSKYKILPLNIEMPYRSEPQNKFQNIMRNWYGNETKYVSALSYRKNTRDFPIFSKMKQGDNYIDGSRIADELFRVALQYQPYKENTAEYHKLKNKIVPKYDREKFENKWRKLSETLPSHTLVAHLEKDTYSHIHPWEPRGISVREAARLQSFPDDFYFNCNMGSAYKQIGNAVPPLLSYAMAKSVRKAFKED